MDLIDDVDLQEADARLVTEKIVGLGIERDLGFSSRMALSGWAAWARRAGSIIAAETLFRRNFRAGDDQLPKPPTSPGEGQGGGDG